MSGQFIDFNALREHPEQYAARLCAINLNALVETLQLHPALVAYSVACYEIARVRVARAEEEVKRARARIYSQVTAADPKKAATKINSEIDACPEVVEATNRWLDASEHAASLKAVVTGLDHRLQMLMQISSRQKQEEKNYNR